jgi:hypothetical protein
VDIVKVQEEQRRVYGWGYVAKDAAGSQVVDASGDFIDTPEAVAALEDAFHRYVLDSREADDNHQTFGVAKLVEAVFMSPNKAETMGITTEVPTGIWVGYEFPTDDVSEAAWQKVKSRESLAFSIVGDGWREDASPDS